LGAADLRQAAGLSRHPHATEAAPPRIHDLRHTFAVNTLIGWYQAGIDVQAHLPVLSTFLGHSSTEATYWYLQAIPELLSLAAERLEPGYHAHAHPCGEKLGRPQ
jgi:integrase